MCGLVVYQLLTWWPQQQLGVLVKLLLLAASKADWQGQAVRCCLCKSVG
jgi:hypothetical protein